MNRETFLYREMKRRTGCTYYSRSRILFPPGGGMRVRWYIKSPFTRKSSLGPNIRIRPYLWVWHESWIYKLWLKWAWKKVREVEEEYDKNFNCRDKVGN